MGIFDVARGRVSVSAGKGVNRPTEMQLRFLPNGQVVFYSDNQEELLNKGFLDNHVVFTIQDWKATKVASAPPILYEIKDQKEYKRYKMLLKDATPASLQMAKLKKLKAMVEVKDDNHEIMKVFKRPNPMMSWFEFAYGHTVYKDIVGSAYWLAVRSGSVNDPTVGKIKELYLPPAHHMQIVSGGMSKPVDKYFLSTNPEVKIDALNVCQVRNFSPRYENETQFLYGLSRLHPARKILQKYNEGVDSEVDIFQKKGIRELVFPKNLPENTEVDYDTMMKARDDWSKKINDSGTGNIMINNAELGSIRIGFTPSELGILESQKLTKKDFCALYKVSDIIFGWNETTTFNNLAESRKISLTDAVIPELEAMADAFNTWYLPSYDKNGKYAIGFDYEYFSELQDDVNDTIKWLKESPVTSNEWRAAIHYGESPEENANKILVSSKYKLLENLSIESFPGDPDLVVDDEEEKEEDKK